MVEKENTTAYISLVKYKIYISNKKNLAGKIGHWPREIKNVVINGVLHTKNIVFGGKMQIWGYGLICRQKFAEV